MKLGQKIWMIKSLLILFFTMALMAAAFVMESHALRKLAEKALVRQARTGAMLIDERLKSLQQGLLAVVQLPDIQSMDFQAQRDILKSMVKRLGFLDLGIVSLDGTVRYILGNETTNLRDRDYVKSALRGKPAISDVLISRVTKKPVVMFSVPVMKKSF